MKETPRHIDLRLPRGWNDCTTEELEQIAAVIMRHTLTQDRYHPFDWLRVKAELFFLLTGTEVLSPVPAADSGDTATAFLCRHDGTTFTLKSWQVHSFIDQHLRWLDDDKAQPLLIFPYKQLLAYHVPVLRWLPLCPPQCPALLSRLCPSFLRRVHIPLPWIERRYHAPQELLQDFGWQQYSHLQDYMSLYITQQNALLKARQAAAAPEASPSGSTAAVPAASPAGATAALEVALTEARNHFLAVLFHCERHPHLVARITPVQWQVILLWWGGMMHYLQKKFPHCFRTAPPKRRKGEATTPLDTYVAITATIQKDAHLSEPQIQAQTFHVILEELERIAKEAEEIERISRKNK